MSGTKTANKNSSKKGDKKKESKPQQIEAKGEDIVQNQAEGQNVAPAEKTKRAKKNATSSQIDFSNTESGRVWLTEFKEQCNNHPPIKGYDQHWNKDGFIHNGPATRLSNRGCANMVTLIGDILVTRAMNGDADAAAALDYCVNFLRDHREATEEARKRAILAEADRIRAQMVVS